MQINHSARSGTGPAFHGDYDQGPDRLPAQPKGLLSCGGKTLSRGIVQQWHKPTNPLRAFALLITEPGDQALFFLPRAVHDQYAIHPIPFLTSANKPPLCEIVCHKLDQPPTQDE